MSKYTITAIITVDVAITIEAKSAQEARSVFDSQLMLNASLTDMPEGAYVVSDDSISDVDRVTVEAA